MYFANLLSFCHEAYEASLATSGIDLRPFFSNRGPFAVPVAHAEADFYRPMYCGDRILIQGFPAQLSVDSFEIRYRIVTAPDDGRQPATQKTIAKAQTTHVCIQTCDRTRHPLPDVLCDWIAAFT